MISINVQTDIAKALVKFHALEPRQFPFVVSRALNETMKLVQPDVRNEMGRAFDKPKPFTLNSLRVLYANKVNLTAGLTFKDGTGGRSAGKYLQPGIHGGARRQKAFEKAIASAGVSMGGLYAVPAKGVPLDAYGNLSRATISQIIKGLRSGAKQWFILTERNGRTPPGVYKRTGKQARMVVAFVARPTYRKQFRFFEAAEAAARKHLPTQTALAAEQAMKTAR